MIQRIVPACYGQTGPSAVLVHFDQRAHVSDFALAERGRATAIYLPAQSPEAVRMAVQAFCIDVKRVTGAEPQMVNSLLGRSFHSLIFVGVDGQSEEIDSMRNAGKLRTTGIDGKWESAVTSVVEHPFANVDRALVIAGSDRRGAAFALFSLSREMGVSPWTWWADVPVPHHAAVYLDAGERLQKEPSVAYRGIFLNDEDWGLRPWAARKMDPEVGNIGPHTYARIFELLLRLHANTLWPAMHPGTLAFNALAENAKLADRWGIVMGTSHSEALLRNNVGEWDEKRDGPWNYQTNRDAIDAYWKKRVVENGHFENFYTVGMRGVHDTGLQATGSTEVKARLVENVMKEQQSLLQTNVPQRFGKVPQVIWLYKESLELYRAGMRVPDAVTLGWTDDNYGYLRQLPTASEQHRPGGSGVYYHVSYWGFPHDYLWLCSTPPALIQEEMTKAFDHNARRYWVLNVGDLKPAEIDLDYFMQLAWDEPSVALIHQDAYLQMWASEQFSSKNGARIARLLSRYYALNFVRKPEFMGFNGYDDAIKRTAFNPLAWGDQNQTRLTAWQRLRSDEVALARTLPAMYRNSYFELVAYPIEAAAAQNEKLLFTDRTFLDAARHDEQLRLHDRAEARRSYERIRELTMRYNTLAGGKWDGMMSDAPRNREVFNMPQTASADDAKLPLPAAWQESAHREKAFHSGGGVFTEQDETVSINAAHFEGKFDGTLAHWRVLQSLGISGDSVEYGEPGLLAEAVTKDLPEAQVPWLAYSFDITGRIPTSAAATLTVSTLPTFAVDADHHLRYAVAIDNGAPITVDLDGGGDWKENSAPIWSENVLRNARLSAVSLGALSAGHHTLRLFYQDPGVIFEHLTITFAGAPAAYPVPPETSAAMGVRRPAVTP